VLMLLQRSQARVDPGHRGHTTRADFLIERFRVRYAFGGGWTCACADFAKLDACRHTREAAGRYFAQTLIAAHVAVGAPRTLTFDIRARSMRPCPPLPAKTLRAHNPVRSQRSAASIPLPVPDTGAVRAAS